MSVIDLLTREYEQMDTWWSGKNKAKTNPIQSQYKPNFTLVPGQGSVKIRKKR
jgi:hypothetical protein